MKRRIIIAVLVVLGVSLTVAAVKLHGPLGETRRSCRVLSQFVEHVQRAEWAEAQAMLDTKPDWFRVEDGKVLYWNHDYTDRFAVAEPKFWKTLEYYLTDRHMGDKVVFQAISRADYARLKDGKITWVKIP